MYFRHDFTLSAIRTLFQQHLLPWKPFRNALKKLKFIALSALLSVDFKLFELKRRQRSGRDNDYGLIIL